jgi:Nucleoside 2-deoxyribosyltransferase/pfkB family carbohydrate kinase
MSAAICVVGGTYTEECAYPASCITRGSGLRAAKTLAGLGAGVRLRSAASTDLAVDVLKLCADAGIDAQFALREVDVWFRYRHPLATPDIFPAVAASVPFTQIEDERVLVFGMIEGRPRVHAKQVVYDPQDGVRSKSFGNNGSVAEELSIVASLSEARALTGKQTPSDMAIELLKENGCRAVIVKCGPQGALVATAESQQWIRPFPSSRVWKIGSGDVFSAAYAHAWMREHMSPLQAAWFASRMVAEYVNTRNEKHGTEALATIRADALQSSTQAADRPRPLPTKSIYLAGPFFSTAQQWLVDEARSCLRDMGFQVFSPIHDVGKGPAEHVAAQDLFALESSGLVFALLDGLDAGTLFEVGYARALDIPVVAVAESLDERPLTMLIGTGCTIANDFASGVYAACWQVMGDV